MIKRKVIIDTDPGHDDCIAILLAARYFNILGITTVYGNQTIGKTTKNVLKILEFSNLTHIPVFRGSFYPINQEVKYGSAIHGETGLDGPVLPDPKLEVQSKHAIDFIIETIMTTADVTLIAIGPLTNIALAIHQEPRIKSHIHEISLMGGTFSIGNISPSVEFNIGLDPEAADIVFKSKIPLKMSSLDLTRQAKTTPEIIERFRKLGTKTSRIVTEILEFYSNQVFKLFGLVGASIHDACSVAWLIDPTLIKSRKLHVDIELKGKFTRGMTVCDLRNCTKLGQKIGGIGAIESIQPPNVDFGIELDVDSFFNLLIDAIFQYP